MKDANEEEKMNSHTEPHESDAPEIHEEVVSDPVHAERFLILVKSIATTPKSEFDKAEKVRKADKKLN